MTKKYISIFFFFMCLIVNLLVNTILSNHSDLRLVNQFTTQESQILGVSIEDNKKSELSNIIKKYDNLSIIKEKIYIGAYSGSAIYFKNYVHNIPLIEGEFFYDSDFQENSNTIVIGKNLESYIKNKDNKKCIDINGVSYRVKGIMGYTNRSSLLDNTFYINLNYYLNQNKSNPINSLVITSNSSDNKSNLFKEIQEISEVSDDGKYDNNTDEYLENNTLLNIGLIFIFSMLINLSILNVVYLGKRKEEIGIRKMYGASNKNIVIIFLKDYILSGVQGIILAFILSIIIIKSHICEEIFNNTIYISSFVITIIITLIVEIMLSYINVYKCNRQSICNLVKEE